MKNKNNIENEVRFLEIDEAKIINKLKSLGAKDLGNEIIKEVIFYDKNLNWKKTNQLVRLRRDQFGIWLTYKHHQEFKIGGTIEVELKINDLDKAVDFLEAVGLYKMRVQEKRRHRFVLGKAEIDITEWPKVPILLEIEANSEKTIKQTADLLELDWNNVYYKDNKFVLEEKYNIPFSDLKIYTFDKIEL